MFRVLQVWVAPTALRAQSHWHCNELLEYLEDWQLEDSKFVAEWSQIPTLITWVIAIAVPFMHVLCVKTRWLQWILPSHKLPQAKGSILIFGVSLDSWTGTISVKATSVWNHQPIQSDWIMVENKKIYPSRKCRKCPAWLPGKYENLWANFGHILWSIVSSATVVPFMVHLWSIYLPNFLELFLQLRHSCQDPSLHPHPHHDHHNDNHYHHCRPPATMIEFWHWELLLMEEIPNNHLGCIKPCK